MNSRFARLVVRQSHRTSPNGFRRTLFQIGMVLVLGITGGCLSATDAGKSECELWGCNGTPQVVPGIPALVQLSAGAYHTCGLAADGAAWCWGWSGVPGVGTPPALVPGSLRFLSLAAGEGHTCGIATDSIAYCWSQVANEGVAYCGPSACTRDPVAVGTAHYAMVVSSGKHSCALDAGGSAYCWGLSYRGETGSLPTVLYELTPVAVPGGHHFSAITAGRYFTCALESGALWCWGSNDAGQLGKADVPACVSGVLGPESCSMVPVRATTSQQFVSLSAGPSHACALTAAHRAYCWGDNGQGQMADGHYGMFYVPTPTTDREWSVIEAGSGHTCATALAGTSYCWGLNVGGRLGSKTTTSTSVIPLPVAGGYSFTVLSAGELHVCGLTSTGEVYCWGDNSMLQLGGT